MWRPHLITTNAITGQEYRLTDAQGLQWFSHYGQAEGSGFGYLTWRCRRPVGYDWPDLGHAFPVVLRKGPFLVLFSGQIVRIAERSGSGGDEIEAYALGWVHAAKADVFNRIYCDTRWAQWVSAETPSGSFRPDLFDWSQDERLYLKPRRGVDFAENDYTYVRYTFPFSEVATHFTASYDVALPNSWPGKLELRDSNGVVLWDKAVTGTGTIDETTTGSPTYFEVRFYCTAAGENTAEDDTVYGELTDVKVYSVDETTLDAKIVADDLVDDVLSDAGHGLSTRKDNVGSPGRDLEPCFFDTDMSPAQVLAWCCQFGDSDDDPLAWGVTFDNDKRLFLEAVDVTTVEYVIRPQQADLERGGDWGESAQKAYGVYTDDAGQVQRTNVRTDQAVIDDLGGYFRKVPLQIAGMTDETLVLEAVDLWLAENAEPKAAGSFAVRDGVHRPSGRFVPFDEITPGGLVQVREWRAREATLSPNDYRDNTTTFPLAGVRVDWEAGTVELIPRETSDAFMRYMAVVSQLAGSL